MIESALFVILSIVAGLFSLLAIFFFVIAITRKSKGMLVFGLGVLIIPLAILGCLYWYYDIKIPRENRAIELKYAGEYLFYKDDSTGIMTKTYRLLLNKDNTFNLDKTPDVNFEGTGKWRAGATDEGDFEFTSVDGMILGWASPKNNSELVFPEGHIKFIRSMP